MNARKIIEGETPKSMLLKKLLEGGGPLNPWPFKMGGKPIGLDQQIERLTWALKYVVNDLGPAGAASLEEWWAMQNYIDEENDKVDLSGFDPDP